MPTSLRTFISHGSSVVEQRTENPCVGGSIPPRGTIMYGVWRSWLARVVWDDEVGGSSPLTPTILKLAGIV